jgi:hypothetical protein
LFARRFGMLGPLGSFSRRVCRFSRRIRWVLARLARRTAIGLLMVKSALLVGGLAGARKFAFGRFSAELRLPLAITATAAAATTPAPSTAFTARGIVLRRAAIGIHVRIRKRLGSGYYGIGRRRSIRRGVRRGLLFALTFALALALSLAFGITLLVAFAIRLAIRFALRRRIAVARSRLAVTVLVPMAASVTIAVAIAVSTVVAATFAVPFLVVAATGAAIARAVTLAVAVPGRASVAITITRAVARAVTITPMGPAALIARCRRCHRTVGCRAGE